MNLDADRVADLAARPPNDLTRRDVALALLTVPADDALASLPGLRRGMLAAGNPLSAAFWSSAEAVLHKIEDGTATVGDVRTWLEATGTEPNGIIGLHVWDDQTERSQLAAEMHTRLVSHLEERLAAGEIDPDLLVAADPAACQHYIAVQERWMTSALPDGRVPMDVLLDEKDEEFTAEWDAADAEALAIVQALLEQVGERPLPGQDLQQACARLRADIARADWPGELLIECGGMRARDLPADDTELWLRLAAGVASPVGSDDWLNRPGRRIPTSWARPTARWPPSARSTTSTGWRSSPRWPPAGPAPPPRPPTWPATSATTTRTTARTMVETWRKPTARSTTSAASMTTTASSTSWAWKACSCRSPRCGRFSARSTTRTA